MKYAYDSSPRLLFLQLPHRPHSTMVDLKLPVAGQRPVNTVIPAPMTGLSVKNVGIEEKLESMESKITEMLAEMTRKLEMVMGGITSLAEQTGSLSRRVDENAMQVRPVFISIRSKS